MQTSLTDAAKAVDLNYDYARAVVRDYNRRPSDTRRHPFGGLAALLTRVITGRTSLATGR